MMKRTSPKRKDKKENELMDPERTADEPTQTVEKKDSQPVATIHVGEIERTTLDPLRSGLQYRPRRSPILTYLGIIVALILGAGGIAALAEISSLARASKALEGV